MRRIGLVDVDLLDKGTRFPNLALMKLSLWKQKNECETALCLTREDAETCDALFCSKVFDYSKEPDWLADFAGRCYKGGTGYFGADSPKLSIEAEHSMPDYHLYDVYVEKRRNAAKTAREKQVVESSTARYTQDSIGFTTRGCFRQCPFCVNRNSRKSELWSPVSEVFDASRKYITLYDDNVFASKDWHKVFDDLEATGKRFSFHQGLDLRLISEDKAVVLERVKYWGEVIFAFDNIADKDKIRESFQTYRRYCTKRTKCYLLTGFYEQGIAAIESVLDRIDLLREFDVLPYVMRYKTCYEGELSSVFSGLAAWCNQPAQYKKRNFFECNEARSKKVVEDSYRLLPSHIIERLKKKQAV